MQVFRNLSDTDASWAEPIVAAGFESVAAIPITSQGALYGVLTVYSSRLNAFEDDERTALERLGTIIAHAVRSVHRETQFRESERRYRALAENIPGSAVAMIDTDLAYQLISGELVDTLGLDLHDFQGKRPTQIGTLPDELGRRLESAFDTALGGEDASIEIEYQNRVLDTHVIPMWNAEHDEITGAVVFSNDITERVEHQRELEYERERLEFLVRLIRHNLLNSLNVVDARLALIEGRVDYEVSNHLETAQNRTDDMIDLIETIRTLTHATVESAEHELDDVPIAEVLTEQVESMATTYPEAEFYLGSVPSVDVRADELLEEAFENILHNAVQHNDKPVPQVNVHVTATEEDVTVSIADDGPGFPEDLKRKIFATKDPWFKDPGTGFGLHIVWEIVDSYDGSISVEENDPEGTVVQITLEHAD